MLWLFLPVAAQQGNYKKDGMAVNFSYYGEIIFHPGIKVSTEFPLWMKAKEQQKKSHTKTKYRSILLIPAAGFYVHANSHTAVFVNTEMCYRKVRAKSGFKLEGLIGIGYQARINAGTTYVVEDDGSVNEKKVAGRSYLTAQLGLGLGQDLYVKKQIPVAWHVRPYAVFWMPYNTTAIPSFDLELGITYRFGRKSK